MSGAQGAIGHHWVPRMVLRNFTLHPEEEDPEIWCQPVGGGAPRRSRIGSECVIRDHNTLTTADLPPKAIEGLYGRIEGDAAPVLLKLLDGRPTNEDERRAMAYLIATQHVRTPRSRSDRRYVMEEGMRLQMLLNASQNRELLRERAREHLRERDGSEPGRAEIEKFVADVIADLESGKIGVRAPHDVDAGVGLLGVNELVGIIYKMAWIGLRLPDSRLIIGDHPVVIVDPRAAPGQPAAWMTSPDVQVLLPLAPNFCLVLEHRGTKPTYGEVEADERTAVRINLASIAHSWRHYYGPTQAIVQSARQLAKRNAADVLRLKPVPGGLVVSHRIEGAPAPHRVEIQRAPIDVKVSRPRKRSPRS